MRRNYGIGFCLGILLLSALYIFSDIRFQERADKEQEREVREVTVSGDEKVYHYRLEEENGLVNVYLEDGSTLYERTSICVEELPKELREEIREGKPIRDMEELFGFLENYSS